MIDLSVLICSTHTRYRTFGRTIQDQIWSQYANLQYVSSAPGLQDRVEIVMLTDNKMMPLGYKRNAMIDMAQGTYVVFVDDDDRIEPDYLASLLDATVTDADVITFLASVSLNGGRPRICRYSKDFTEDRNTPYGYERLPNHICAVKRELAGQARFHNPLSVGEDADYAKKLHPLLRTEHHINRVLYHYDFNVETTETQGKSHTDLIVEPVADVVFMSASHREGDTEMTQRAIDTCLAGAGSLPVNIFVVEQNPDVKYDRAVTLHPDWEFNYNGSANAAAKLGSAEWIVVANNDLLFGEGWLHKLLSACHPVVSPKCPRDVRQRNFRTNTLGHRIGYEFSGWCFMMRRDVWELIGGLDDRVKFWGSDDVVVEQLRAHGITPMLVPAAEVTHLRSVTLNNQDRQVYDELTWGQLDVFIDLYGSHRLQNHPSYLRWKAQRDK